MISAIIDFEVLSEISRKEVEGKQMVAPPESLQRRKSGGEESPSSAGQGGP